MAYLKRKAYMTDRPHDVDNELWDWFTGRVDEMPVEGYFVHDLIGIFRRHESAIVAEWLKDHPDSRPPLWWQWCAPEPRRQLGGQGVRLTAKCPAVLPQYRCGVPCDYVETDSDDPPRFESEADYLRRLGL